MPSLFDKYKIEKTNGKPVDPKAKYFVLRYDKKSKDPAAVKALLQYAHLTQNDELKADIENEQCL